MTGRLSKLLLTVVLLGAMLLPVGADLLTTDSGTDTAYSGALDPRTLQPSQNHDQTGENATVLPLGDGSYGFDRERQQFASHVGSKSFYSSVPPGAILSRGQSVSFNLSGSLTGILYRDGEVVEEVDLTQINQPGSYLLQVQGSSSYDAAQFTFTILNDITGALTDYTLPGGFVFDSVLVDGVDLDTEYNNYVQFLSEGKYQLQYSCPEVGRSYTLSFQLDRTPPALALAGVNEGQAKGPVSLKDLEPGAYVIVEQDGASRRITDPGTVLNEAGRYTLTVYDQAGNSSQYRFVIQIYLNISAVTAIALVLLGVSGVMLYSRWVRRHVRVG